MARSEYSEVPDEQAQGDAPDDYQHLQAAPEDFGAQIAKGAENLGSGIIDAEKFYDTAASDNGLNNFLLGREALLHGDPNKKVPAPDGTMVPDTGYMGLNGADAMRARPQVWQQLQDLANENRASLATPAARVQYDNQARRYMAQSLSEIGTHADQQQKVWAIDNNNTAGLLAANAIGRAPNNPDVIKEQTENLKQAYAKNAQIRGESQDGALLKATQDATIVRLNALRISDPAAAQQVFDTDGSVLASRPDYDTIARGVKESVINSQIVPATTSAIATAKATAASRVGVAGQPADLTSAILGQESGGNPSAPTSVNGAVGVGQMKPGTFAQFAKPGEDINKPADNAAVANRAIQHYSQQFNGDAARVAVAYFSGPGNVAPAGSPTPYLHDYKDGNGKSVSSYVGDIQGRAAGRTFPTMADALRGTMDETLTQAQADAQKMFPQYPDAQERYVQGVRRGLEQTISQQDQQTIINNHIVQQAMASDRPPINEQQLMALGPQVAQAWRAMQVDNPLGAMSMERQFDANAKGKALNYGSQFRATLDRVLAPAGSPDRITAASQYSDNVDPGENGRLSNTGAGVLNDVMAWRNSPQGDMAAPQMRAFLQKAHGMISGQSAAVDDPIGEVKYGEFLKTALPQIIGAKGDAAANLYDPKGPLAQSITNFQRPTLSQARDYIYRTDVKAADTWEDNTKKLNLSDSSIRKQAFASLKGLGLPKAQAQQLALRYKLVAPNPPSVPLPQ